MTTQKPTTTTKSPITTQKVTTTTPKSTTTTQKSAIITEAVADFDKILYDEYSDDYANVQEVMPNQQGARGMGGEFNLFDMMQAMMERESQKSDPTTTQEQTTTSTEAPT